MSYVMMFHRLYGTSVMMITKGGVYGQHSMLAYVDFQVVQSVIEEEMLDDSVPPKKPRDFYGDAIPDLGQLMCWW